jgi:hypothetical protein
MWTRASRQGSSSLGEEGCNGLLGQRLVDISVEDFLGGCDTEIASFSLDGAISLVPAVNNVMNLDLHSPR